MFTAPTVPMAWSRNFRTGHLSMAILSAVALAPTTHAQGSQSGTFSPSLNMGLPAFQASPTGTPPELFAYGADVGIGETDNVGLVPSGKVSQTIAISDVDFALNEQSRLLAAQAKGDFTFLDYLQGAFGSQLIGRFDGLGTFSIVPERLIWVVQDDFGQAALDPYTPVTPNNMQNIDYFTTGPNLLMRFGGVNFVNVNLRYSRAQYSSTPFDSNRVSASLAIGREISAGADLSLNGASEKVMFSNTSMNTNFVRSSVYGKYELQAARTGFEAELGATTIDDSASTITTPGALPGLPATSVFIPAHSTTGPLARLQLSRQVSPKAKVTISGGRELTDASSSFSTLQSGAIGVVGTANAIQSTSSYTSTFASAGWQYAFNRTTIALTARWEKDDYTSQPVYNLKREGAEFSIERRLTRTVTAQLLGRYYKYDYPYAAVVTQFASTDYADGLVGLALAWRHGRALEVRLRVDHDTQNVVNGNDGYKDNRAFLTVGYRPASAPEPAEPVEAP